ncbi:hypothetical protein HQ531_06570 [bacterium]|nr:hypothetical protein [bacterium]
MKAKTNNIIIGFITLALIAVVVMYSLMSLTYLGSPAEERHLLREMDALYSPSGLYGHGVGFLAALVMLMLWFYILRKQWRKLSGMGRLSQWLKYHMLFGLTAPLLAGYHAAFRFEGLIGVMYWAMLAVMLSGIVGRYLYGHIPRRRDGHEMSLKQMNTEKAARLRELQMEFGIASEDINQLQGMTQQSESRSVLISLVHLFLFDLRKRIQTRQILTSIRSKYGVSAKDLALIRTTIEKQLLMSQRVMVLDAVSKVFHWWHVIHKPFAYAIIVVLTLHIVLTLSFGFTWIF